jgi:hypothetical protein
VRLQQRQQQQLLLRQHWLLRRRQQQRQRRVLQLRGDLGLMQQRTGPLRTGTRWQHHQQQQGIDSAPQQQQQQQQGRLSGSGGVRQPRLSCMTASDLAAVLLALGRLQCNLPR